MIYFISDAHLGSRLVKDPKEHEKKLVDWLDKVKKDATVIYLLGDMFDFWFEYRTVVPKGFVRFWENWPSWSMRELKSIFLQGIMISGHSDTLKMKSG